jgi:hypothetical protein
MNKEIAFELGIRPVEIWVEEDGVYVPHIVDNTPDYMYDWNELMPLVIEYGLSHYTNIGRPRVHKLGHLSNGTYGETFYSSGATIQAAYCRCLLKVLKHINKT